MNIVSKFLTFQNQIKILHWQTTSYSEHKTLDGLYEALEANIDDFVETFMGKYGRIVSQNNFNLTLENYKNLSHIEMITDNSSNGMQGSGLFIINSPWSIEKDIKESLKIIFDCLKKSKDLSKLLFKNNIN